VQHKIEAQSMGYQWQTQWVQGGGRPSGTLRIIYNYKKKLT